jgi:hypothetical protein
VVNDIRVAGLLIVLNYRLEGVMLFVVREIGDRKSPSAVDLPPGGGKHLSEQFQQDNVEKYLSKGYRMADVKFFSGILAERIGVGKTEMDTYLNALKTYAKRGESRSHSRANLRG